MLLIVIAIVRNPCADYIVLYDGPNTTSPILRKACGHFAHFLHHTTSNAALIVFHSDNHTVRRDLGFQALYAAIGEVVH